MYCHPSSWGLRVHSEVRRRVLMLWLHSYFFRPLVSRKLILSLNVTVLLIKIIVVCPNLNSRVCVSFCSYLMIMKYAVYICCATISNTSMKICWKQNTPPIIKLWSEIDIMCPHTSLQHYIQSNTQVTSTALITHKSWWWLIIILHLNKKSWFTLKNGEIICSYNFYTSKKG